MIVFGYGLQKSASSFCFQLVTDMLDAAGQDQAPFRTECFPQLKNVKGKAFVTTNWDTVSQIIDYVERDHDGQMTVAVKTHSALTPRVEALMTLGWATAFATHRDFRDAALSMFEHGQRLRDSGAPMDRNFASLETLDDALLHIANQKPRLQQWMDSSKVCSISYDTLRQNPGKACEKIANHLGLEVDYNPILKKYLGGEAKIGNYNVGEVGRFMTEATDRQKRLADHLFGPVDD